MHELIWVSLLLDISHINIWHQGDKEQVVRTFDELLPRAKAVHLSDNNGYSYSHDLLPAGVWFESQIHTWAEHLLVTYESLPVAWAQYERLDKRRKCGAVLEVKHSDTDNVLFPGGI